MNQHDFNATRAFEIEPFEDEGPHYIVELTDGSVLSLVGQYLYEYAPDPKLNRPREFPCTDFTVKRHPDGYPVQIICRGEPFEPECVMPPYCEEDLLADRIMEDDLIVTDRTYDQIKRECMQRNKR